MSILQRATIKKTPVDTHTAIVRDCLDAGLNIFCEKPLDENPHEMESIFELARQKNKKIYIDDVFLWREEYRRLKALSARPIEISFRMTKHGTFNDSLLNAYAYHDLYMLLDLTRCAPITNLEIIKIESPLEKNRIDILEFTCMSRGVRVHCYYDRTKEKKEKTIVINSNIVWANDTITIEDKKETYQNQDALALMLKSVLAEKADFIYNNELAFKTTLIVNRMPKILQNTARESKFIV